MSKFVLNEKYLLNEAAEDSSMVTVDLFNDAIGNLVAALTNGMTTLNDIIGSLSDNIKNFEETAKLIKALVVELDERQKANNTMDCRDILNELIKVLDSISNFIDNNTDFVKDQKIEVNGKLYDLAIIKKIAEEVRKNIAKAPKNAPVP